MSNEQGMIQDEILRGKFNNFCLAWGVDPDVLVLENYIDMIGLYYQDQSLGLRTQRIQSRLLVPGEGPEMG